MGKVVVESPLVHSLFKCSLCHGLIRSATVINQCLHRFCKFCITNYFETTNKNQCPTCDIEILNPIETLKSDLIFQRLLYKLFPSVFRREITYKPSLLSSSTATESTRVHLDTTIDVYLEYWDISSDMFPNSNEDSATLASCYLECAAGTPLKLIERFLRLRHSLDEDLQIDLFYERLLLNKESERLIDVCYCFDRLNKNQTIELRFLVSPFGYRAILNRIRQLKTAKDKIEIEIDSEPAIKIVEAVPLEIVVPEKPSVTLATSASTSPTSSSCDSPSADPKLKVKIRRSQVSTNDWYISQPNVTTTPTKTTITTSKEPVELPDLVNSCEATKKPGKRKQDGNSNNLPATKRKTLDSSTFFGINHFSQMNRMTNNKGRSKPRRRTPFIPTMVQAPPSIFDRLSNNQYDYNDRDSDSLLLCSNSEFLRGSVTTMRPDELVIVNVEGNVTEPHEERRTKKTVCKVPPYVPEKTSLTFSPTEKTSAIIKPTPIYPNALPVRRTLIPKKSSAITPPPTSQLPAIVHDSNDVIPLDLSLK